MVVSEQNWFGFLGFFSTEYKLWSGFVTALCKISPQSAFSLWSLKLNLSSRPPRHHMSSPFPSPPRLWEMSFSLLKMPQQRPFCWAPPWQHCLPLAGLCSLSVHHHRCQLLFPSGLPDLSRFCLPPTYIQILACPWVLCPSTPSPGFL